MASVSLTVARPILSLEVSLHLVHNTISNVGSRASTDFERQQNSIIPPHTHVVWTNIFQILLLVSVPECPTVAYESVDCCANFPVGLNSDAPACSREYGKQILFHNGVWCILIGNWNDRCTIAFWRTLSNIFVGVDISLLCDFPRCVDFFGRRSYCCAVVCRTRDWDKAAPTRPGQNVLHVWSYNKGKETIVFRRIFKSP